jgi:hypothetical protein
VNDSQIEQQEQDNLRRKLDEERLGLLNEEQFQPEMT